jgi:hypothetical protein
MTITAPLRARRRAEDGDGLRGRDRDGIVLAVTVLGEQMQQVLEARRVI